MNRLTLTILKHGKAVCPLCLNPLDEGNMYFCYEAAFCQTCLSIASKDTLKDTRYSLLMYIRDEHRACVKGLWFFTPAIPPPSNVVGIVLDRLSQFVDMERLIESEEYDALLAHNQRAT